MLGQWTGTSVKKRFGTHIWLINAHAEYTNLVWSVSILLAILRQRISDYLNRGKSWTSRDRFKWPVPRGKSSSGTRLHWCYPLTKELRKNQWQECLTVGFVGGCTEHSSIFNGAVLTYSKRNVQTAWCTCLAQNMDNVLCIRPVFRLETGALL